MKKGSKQAKAWGRRMKMLRNKTSSSTKRRVVTMPKRRRTSRVRRAAGRSYRSRTSGLQAKHFVAGSVISVFTKPIINSLSARFVPGFLGQIGDDVLFLIAGWYGSKKFKNKYLKVTALVYMIMAAQNLVSAAASGGINSLFSGKTETETTGRLF